ncbi:MAG: methyltransferase domain-containing protein [Nitrospirae bacterium]|nr:methyltransferase domain-containing protein [Nitrospirota bacterium]
MNEIVAKELLKKVVEDYDSIADSFDKTRKNQWKEFEIFLPYIKNGSNFADIGCGNGRFLKFLNKHKKVDYVGIDNSNKLLNKAKKENPDVKFLLGDMLDVPLDKNTQDVVGCIAAFHHLPTEELRKIAVSEFSRILKKNGILILTVWNLYQAKYEKYIGENPNYGPQDSFIPWEKSGINRYYYAFKAKELKKILEEKFEIIQSITGNNFVFVCKKK